MANNLRSELLTNDQMGAADRAAIEGGIAGLSLMKVAGGAVSKAVIDLAQPSSRVLVLCGPGNNGGDGFVAAKLLAAAGYDIRLGLLGPRGDLTGDAALAAAEWGGPIEPAGPNLIDSGVSVIVDALLGAGLRRPIDAQSSLGALVQAINTASATVVAVDVPSGLDGSTGLAAGAVVAADVTVTFFRKKPGHVLFPGRRLCGRTVLADIGIPESVLPGIRAGGGPAVTDLNGPGVWGGVLPQPEQDAHKYARGHAVSVSGPAHTTGAARLGARGAARIGAGLVTVASPVDALGVNGAHLTSIMLVGFKDVTALATVFDDQRKNAALIGPGFGVGEKTREAVYALLAKDASLVLDADALTSFSGHSDGLFGAIRGRGKQDGSAGEVVLTPHGGEFHRVFASCLSGEDQSKLDQARRAATASGATVVLKGADTVVAAADGRAAINDNAPPWLATAGSGDVLAGFITGLLAQGMPGFEAACAGVWLHGECGQLAGRGLIAEDLPEVLPQVLKNYWND